jgi:hypothetical protein
MTHIRWGGLEALSMFLVRIAKHMWVDAGIPAKDLRVYTTVTPGDIARPEVLGSDDACPNDKVYVALQIS